jgi:ribosome-associated translation inhibitor RaiA
MTFTQLPIEFYNEAMDDDRRLYEAVEDRLERLADQHHDITGAMVKITLQAENRATPHANEVTIRLYMAGNDVVVKETGVDAEGALREALRIAERLVRERRAKQRPQDNGMQDSTLDDWRTVVPDEDDDADRA